MDHADDVVELFAEDGEAGVAFGAELGEGFVQRDVGAHGDDVGARDHDVVGLFAAQAQDVGDQGAFLAV